MAALFDFEVHTPERLFFSGRVEAVVVTLVDGEAGIYANHSPFTAPSESCILRIKDDKGQWRSAFTSSGILEVKDMSKYKNVLIVDSAEWPHEIDRERVIASKKQAEADLEMAVMKFEIDNAKAKLRRAEVRLKACELRETGS
ncbi:MAG: ATP synthase F1 subunit epsilon [Desulfovibrionaceae bacterium]|nr:ATP synthase F1 subunit epsilon [Desulfovibrionaceae bacterium]